MDLPLGQVWAPQPGSGNLTRRCAPAHPDAGDNSLPPAGSAAHDSRADAHGFKRSGAPHWADGVLPQGAAELIAQPHTAHTGGYSRSTPATMPGKGSTRPPAPVVLARLRLAAIQNYMVLPRRRELSSWVRTMKSHLVVFKQEIGATWANT